MNRRNLFSIILLIFLISTFFISYAVHRSYVLQAAVLSEINTNSYTENTFKRLQRNGAYFPNISVTALPMRGILARYFYAFGNTSRALDVLNEKPEYKDYLFFNENLKGIIYNELGVRDSSLYYAKLSFENLPGNANHYEQYIKNLVAIRDTTAIVKSFEKTKYKFDYQFSKVFLAAILNLQLKSDEVKNIALEIKSLFPSNSELILMTDYVLYGVENVNTSIDLSKIAEIEFQNNNFLKALELFLEANKLNPTSYTNSENIGLCYFKLEKYKEAIPYFKEVVEKFNPMTGKSEYLLAMSYKFTGKTEGICKLLQKSYKLNFKLALAEYNLLCNKF